MADNRTTEDKETFIWGRILLSAAFAIRIKDEQICSLACRALLVEGSCQTDVLNNYSSMSFSSYKHKLIRTLTAKGSEVRSSNNLLMTLETASGKYFRKGPKASR